MTPVLYGDGVADRIKEASGGSIDAFIDDVNSGMDEPAPEEQAAGIEKVAFDRAGFAGGTLLRGNSATGAVGGSDGLLL